MLAAPLAFAGHVYGRTLTQPCAAPCHRGPTLAVACCDGHDLADQQRVVPARMSMSRWILWSRGNWRRNVNAAGALACAIDLSKACSKARSRCARSRIHPFPARGAVRINQPVTWRCAVTRQLPCFADRALLASSCPCKSLITRQSVLALSLSTRHKPGSLTAAACL